MRGRALGALIILGFLGGCAGSPPVAEPPASRALYPNETPELRRLIDNYAAAYGVPRDLVQRVVIRESRHVPSARNGPYYGLMQILPQTARTMGYRGSPARARAIRGPSLHACIDFSRSMPSSSPGRRRLSTGTRGRGRDERTRAEASRSGTRANYLIPLVYRGELFFSGAVMA